MEANKTVTNFQGDEAKVTCLGCAIVNHQIPNPGAILQSHHFDIHQDFEIPIPGFVIATSMRHIQSIEDFTPEERQDFMKTIADVRKAQRDQLGIEYVYLVQEEDTAHHFHLWMFPRYTWMQEKFGRNIESVRPTMEYARQNLKTPENIEAVNQAVQKLKLALN